MSKKKTEKQEFYYLFSKYKSDSDWKYFGEFPTREICELEMEQNGEFEDIEYMIIKGYDLRYVERLPILPYSIVEE